jgi:hypothetical protein
MQKLQRHIILCQVCVRVHWTGAEQICRFGVIHLLQKLRVLWNGVYIISHEKWEFGCLARNIHKMLVAKAQFYFNPSFLK